MMELEQLYKIVSDVLELPVSFVLTPRTEIATIPGWDSLAWIAIISSVEETCGREFPLDGVDEIRTLGDLFRAAAT